MKRYLDHAGLLLAAFLVAALMAAAWAGYHTSGMQMMLEAFGLCG